ncbi:MAG: 4Fe-4S dicluster domain-containing protein [Nitrospinae bacterium]|nr:4Fe-4S dicluster domain-containing protein [Nitrospinota bacterium]
MAKQMVMVIDLRRCIGCQACTVACKTENKVGLGRWRTMVRTYEKGQYPNAKRYFFPTLCNQCGSCMKASKKSGGDMFFKRPDGIIDFDQAKAKKDASGVYEAAAIEACPVEAVSWDKHTGLPDKCNFCAHRVDAGLMPACVQTCIGKSRVFGDLNDPDSEVSKLIAQNGVAQAKEKEKCPGVYYIGLDMFFSMGMEGFREVTPAEFTSGKYKMQQA